MPKQPTKGTIQIGAELPTDLVNAVREFAERRGEKLRDVLAMALRRHLANPPPPPQVELPPLPPLTAKEPEAEKPAPKKKGGKK